MLGVSTVATFAESTAGVADGAKTGGSQLAWVMGYSLVGNVESFPKERSKLSGMLLGVIDFFKGSRVKSPYCHTVCLFWRVTYNVVPLHVVVIYAIMIQIPMNHPCCRLQWLCAMNRQGWPHWPPGCVFSWPFLSLLWCRQCHLLPLVPSCASWVHWCVAPSGASTGMTLRIGKSRVPSTCKHLTALRFHELIFWISRLSLQNQWAGVHACFCGYGNYALYLQHWLWYHCRTTFVESWLMWKVHEMFLAVHGNPHLRFHRLSSWTLNQSWQLNFFWFSTLGEMIQFWRAHFSNGLVQPPTSFILLATIDLGMMSDIDWVKSASDFPLKTKDCHSVPFGSPSPLEILGRSVMDACHKSSFSRSYTWGRFWRLLPEKVCIDLVDAMMSSLIASECHSTSLDAKEARALSLNARLFGLVSLWKEWRQRTNSA